MTVQRYTNTAILLHWLIAFAIGVNVALALSWPHLLPDAAVRPAIDLHKSIGVTVLGLALVRLLWRFSHPPPASPTTYQHWEQVASSTAHGLLYVIMLLMPLTGWIMDSAWKDAAAHPMHYFGSPVKWPRLAWIVHLAPPVRDRVHDWFGVAHALLAYGLYGLFALHVAGALKHQWLDGEPELQRMAPGRD